MVLAVLGDSLCGGYVLNGRFVDDAAAAFTGVVAAEIGASRIGIVALRGAMIGAIASEAHRLPAESDLLIVSAGTNDMVMVAAGVHPVEAVVDAFAAMIAAAHASMPAAHIVVVGLRDVAAMDPDEIGGAHAIQKLRHPEAVRAATAAFNERILSLPDTTGIELAHRAGSDSVELFPDAIHPSPLGVRWLADAVLEALRGAGDVWRTSPAHPAID